MDGGAWWAAVHGVTKSQTWLNDFTFTFHFQALEKEMATHSSVLAWRIPGTAEPGGLLSMGSHRVRHDWSDLAAAAVSLVNVCIYGYAFSVISNKSLPRVMSRFLHMFSSRNFIVSCPMFKTLVHFELIFPPLYVLGTVVKNQLTTYAQVNFWIFYPILLVYLSCAGTILFNYCRSNLF